LFHIEEVKTNASAFNLCKLVDPGFFDLLYLLEVAAVAQPPSFTVICNVGSYHWDGVINVQEKNGFHLYYSSIVALLFTMAYV
jgi:hypothetical protein